MEVAARRALRSPSPNRHANPAVLLGSDAESRGAYLVECAKRIFEQYDRDGSGDLDDGEVATCLVDLFQNLQKKLPPQFQMNLMSEVRKVIALNDMDHNGRLNFVEFIRLLTRKPWRDLLPPDVQAALPMLVMRLAREHTPLWDWEALGKQAPEAFLSVLAEYFNKAAGRHETDAILPQELSEVIRGTCDRI